MTYQVGSGNPFAAGYSDQCTYWAQERYHQLTGIWTPCTGNAFQWPGQAKAAGWQVTLSPPQVPSIICLQAGAGQGLISNFGHVAIVEKVNSDGSVTTSNYNWPIGTKNTTVAFRTGPGVSFIFASPDVGSIGTIQKVQTILLSTKKLVPVYTLSSTQEIKDFLANVDDVFTLYNPFDVPQNQVSGSADSGGNYPQENTTLGISFIDPMSWLQAVGSTIINDSVALLLRLVCIIIGVYIFYRIIDHFLDISDFVKMTSQFGGVT